MWTPHLHDNSIIRQINKFTRLLLLIRRYLTVIKIKKLKYLWYTSNWTCGVCMQITVLRIHNNGLQTSHRLTKHRAIPSILSFIVLVSSFDGGCSALTADPAINTTKREWKFPQLHIVMDFTFYREPHFKPLSDDSNGRPAPLSRFKKISMSFILPSFAFPSSLSAHKDHGWPK